MDIHTFERKVYQDLDTFKNIPKELNRDREHLALISEYHPLIKEIDNVLYNDRILCNEILKTKIEKQNLENVLMKYKHNEPLLREKNIGCGLNVLSFLNVIPEKSARAKITCLDIDSGLTMNQIKDLIVKYESWSEKENLKNVEIQVKKIDIKILYNILGSQLDNETATIIRTYPSNTTKLGHTMVICKLLTKLYLFDPQNKVYAELNYVSDKFSLISLFNDLPDYSDYTRLEQYLNQCVSFEFFIINRRLQVVPPIQKTPVPFEPMNITTDMPFHMFLLVAHGATVYADNHKEPLPFQYHSLGFFVEKNISLYGYPEKILKSISDGMRSENKDLYVYDTSGTKVLGSYINTQKFINNMTGEINVYPMIWGANPKDPPKMKDVMGLYHLLYNDEKMTFDIVEKIFDYNYFIDRNTGNSRNLYYGHIIRKCNTYYEKNKDTHFKNIPKQLIPIAIWSCRVPYYDTYTNIPMEGDMELIDQNIDEDVEENVSDLTKFLKQRRLKQTMKKKRKASPFVSNANRSSSSSRREHKRQRRGGSIVLRNEPVSQEEFLDFIRKEQAMATIGDKPTSRISRMHTTSRISRKKRKTRKTPNLFNI